ncbi:MAG: HAMP domain-containing sensor histidine kinase [Minicystis sp.]
MLHEFLTANSQEIVRRARAKAATRRTLVPTEAEMKNGVPLLLTQIIDRLRLATSDSGAIEESATTHGRELLAMGFTVSQVVHGYGDLCQIITELADETSAPITAGEFHTFNLCLDDAIANAVTEYQRQRDETTTYEGMERLGVLAHELRNRLNSAILAFTILQQGTVAIGGSTGAVLGRSLRALRDLINNALAGVRIEAGLGQRHRVSVSDIIADAELEASMVADRGGYKLTVSAAPVGIDVDADHQILSAAVNNLLQNAFKFSHPQGHISLRTIATADRVVIEVEDECGGLPPGKSDELFHAFEQRSTNRSGLGLGLGISRKGIEAMGGKVSVRDLAGKGCVFSIDLPRLPMP